MRPGSGFSITVGGTFPREEILNDFGLTLDDFYRLGKQRALRRRSGA